jgi:hypothetical protein
MKSEQTEYIAVVKQWRKTTLQDIIDYMVAEGSGFTRPQVLALLEKLDQTIEHFIKERGSLAIPMLHFRTTITGVFCDENDIVDSKQHKVKIRITPGPKLKKIEAQLKVKKEIHEDRSPILRLFGDLTNKSINNQTSHGNMSIIRGSNIRFDPEDVEQGIFFISENDPPTKIRVDSYGEIKSTQVHFIVPHLLAGNYTVSNRRTTPSFQNPSSMRGIICKDRWFCNRQCG